MAQPIMFPEDLYARIAAQAAKQGKSPEEWVQMLAEDYLQTQPEPLTYENVPGYDPALDPLAPFAGKYLARVTDLSARHDAYIAEEASDTHADK